MSKKLIVLWISILILSYERNAKAGFNEENDFENIKTLPNEIIIHIGNFLYSNDFLNFTLTCHPIQRILMEHEYFFIPSDHKEVKQIIERTSFEEFPQLLLSWGRAKKKEAINSLRKVIKEFEDFYPLNAEDNLKPYKENFANYIKGLNLLYGLGDLKVKENYNSLYDRVQFKLHLAKGPGRHIYEPELHDFYLENFSLLDADVRESLSEDYRQGSFPFEKSFQKAEEFSKPLPFLFKHKITKKRHFDEG